MVNVAKFGGPNYNGYEVIQRFSGGGRGDGLKCPFRSESGYEPTLFVKRRGCSSRLGGLSLVGVGTVTGPL